VRSFLDAGMNDHVGKPFDGAKLCNSVRRWLPSAEGSEVSGARNSQPSEAMKYEELVGALDVSGAVRVTTKFLDQLSAANSFTPQNQRREAHEPIGSAGAPGFPGVCVASAKGGLEFAS
jgi:DNA-binding response OmpR family regulator